MNYFNFFLSIVRTIFWNRRVQNKNSGILHLASTMEDFADTYMFITIMYHYVSVFTTMVSRDKYSRASSQEQYSTDKNI